jgi:uncharacterized membrane protein
MGRIALVALLALPGVASAQDAASLAPLGERLLALFGRLHPTLVHFPICLLIVTAVLEAVAIIRRTSEINRIGLHALLWASASAFVATIAGLANASHQDFFGETADFLAIHLWGGLVVTTVALVAALTGLGSFELRPHRQRALYRILTISNALFMCYIAHFGGLLVHGADYFAEPLSLASNASLSDGGMASIKRSALNASKDSIAVIPPPSRRKINFEKDIHPILKENCAKCHDDGKSKGDYRIDDRELFIKGGKTGAAIIPGDSQASYLVKLISGVEPKKIMPSKGRLLTAEEIGVIRAWIDQGAVWGKLARKNSLTPKKPTTPRRPQVPATESPTLTNPIDSFITTYWSKHDATKTLSLNSTISDETFIRRAYYDLHGTTPTKEIIDTFAHTPSPEKRRDLIRSLLNNRQAFASHWLTWWNDLLRNDYSGPGFLHGGRADNSPWIYASLYNNLPYNQFANDLIAPRKSSAAFINGVKWWEAGNVTANEEIGMQAAQNVGQLFMGINLKCASCHNSFTDEWKLRETYAFANAFSQKPLGVHECNVPTGETMEPGFLYPELGQIQNGNPGKRRKQAAALITSDQNGRFARTFVNRVWQRLFGAGIIEPLDEMDQPAWDEDLLDWLASEFVSQQYDINKLLELLMTSQAYQLPSVGTTEKISKDFVFKGPLVRRKNGEELLDSVASAFDVVPTALSADVERALAVTVLNTKLSDAAERQKEAVLFRSGEIAPNTSPVPFEVNLTSSDSNLWLIVLRRFDKTSELDRQRAQFDQVQKQDSGLLDLKVSSSQTQRDKKSQRAKGIKKLAMKEDQAERYLASFENLRFRVGSRDLPLVAIDPQPSVFEEKPVATAATEGSKTSSEAPITSIGQDTIKTRAFTAIRINFAASRPASFSGRVLSVSPSPEPEHKVEFLIVRGLALRSVFLESSPSLLNLGRPRREQITTRRATAATTMQVLELSTGDGLTDLVSKGSAAILTRTKTGGQTTSTSLEPVAVMIFNRLLGRDPSQREIESLRSNFGPTINRAEVEDLIWSLCMLPEFQLVT